MPGRLSPMRGRFRKIAGDATTLTLGTGLLGQLFFVASGVFAARLLGAEDRGYLALIALVPIALAQLGGLGLPVATTFYIAKRPEDARGIVTRLTPVSIAQGALLTAIHAGLLVIVTHVTGLPWPPALLSLVVIPAWLAQQYALAVLQGTQSFGRFNGLRTLPVAFYATGLTVLGMEGVTSLMAVTAVWVGATVVAALATVVASARVLPPRSEGGPKTRELLRFGSRALIDAASPVEAFRVDQAVVGLFLSPRALGVYVVALAFTNLPRFIGQSIGMVAYPRTAATRAHVGREIRRYVTHVVLLTGGIVVGLEALMPRIVPMFFGPEFAQAVPLARLILVASYLVAIRRVFADCLRGAGRPGIGTAAEILSWIVLFPLLALFSAIWGLTGVALALVIASGAGLLAVGAIGAFYMARRSDEFRTKGIPTSGVPATYPAAAQSSRVPHGRFAQPWKPGSALGGPSLLRRVDSNGILFTLLVLFASLLLATSAAFGDHELIPTLAVCFVALVTVFQVLVWRGVLGSFPFASVPLLMLNGVGVFGVLFHKASTSGAVSAAIPDEPTIYRQATLVFIVASLAWWFGGVIGAIGGTSRASAYGFASHKVFNSAARVKVFPTALVSSIPLAFGIAGFSVSGLWRRPFYLEVYGPSALLKLSFVLLPIGLAGTALLLFKGRHSIGRRWGFFLLGLYAAYLFATGSRAIVLLPLVLFGTYVVLSKATGTRGRINPVVVCGVVITSAFLLHLALALRGGNAGLAPYTARIAADPSILWANPLNLVGNVLFSVPLAGFISLHEDPLPLSYLLTSINPLPGSMTAWDQIRDSLRVNVYTPFSALGELALYGLPFLGAYFAVAGFVASRLQIWASRLYGITSVLALSAVAACMPLFAFEVLQYNLRSATRVLWYAAFAVLLFQVFAQRRSRGLAVHVSRETEEVAA